MNCARCNHKLSDHCPGCVKHSLWKDEKAQDGRQKRSSICKTKHCNLPLCSCMDFVRKS